MEELEADSRNRTWKVVKLPPGKQVVSFKWIFKVKRNIDGSVGGHGGGEDQSVMM